ncbi:hypothetical protein D3C76_678990 [compost metagenome]
MHATLEQRQARLQGQLVAGFIGGGRQALEGRDHPVQGAQRLDLDFFPGHHRHVGRRGVQAELRALTEQLLGAEVEGGGGELDAVAEGLAEVFFAAEGQDVEVGVEVTDGELVAAVVVEGAQCSTHSSASIAATCGASCASMKFKAMPLSSL